MPKRKKQRSNWACEQEVKRLTKKVAQLTEDLENARKEE
jgi:hypothetical protein